MSKLEAKYPLQFEKARVLTSRELQRGVSFYENVGGLVPSSYTLGVGNEERR